MKTPFWKEGNKPTGVLCCQFYEAKWSNGCTRKEDFDLILLDLAMPDFSGTDVIKSLKQGGLIDLNNIVIFTASSDRTIMDKIKDSGIKEILK